MRSSLLTLVIILSGMPAHAYQGGSLKNHNHTTSAGDGGQLSNLSVIGPITSGCLSISTATGVNFCDGTSFDGAATLSMTYSKIVTLTAGNSWTVPGNVYFASFQGWAAGGGGGSATCGTSQTYYCGAGGGAGEYATFIATVTAGEIITFSTGTGGGAAAGGGNTTLSIGGQLITLHGGAGGGSGSGSGPGSPGAGGSGAVIPAFASGFALAGGAGSACYGWSGANSVSGIAGGIGAGAAVLSGAGAGALSNNAGGIGGIGAGGGGAACANSNAVSLGGVGGAGEWIVSFTSSVTQIQGVAGPAGATGATNVSPATVGQHVYITGVSPVKLSSSAYLSEGVNSLTITATNPAINFVGASTFFQNSNDSNNLIRMNDGANNMVVTTDASLYLRGTAGVKMDVGNVAMSGGSVLLTGGSVSIGTSSPSAKLHVSSGTLIIDGTGAPATGYGLCFTAGNVLGHCTTVLGVTGTCTCVSP